MQPGGSNAASATPGDGEAFPGIRLSVASSAAEVTVVVLKECMAAGPLSPDCREGD